MNNDLISRSELKSVLKNECFWCANRDEPCDKSCWRCINEKIDNAPTVEPEEVYMTAKDYNLYLEGYKQGKKDFERPQGEWHWNEQGYFYCNKCNRQPRDQYAVTNFCPNCGARMQEGGVDVRGDKND